MPNHILSRYYVNLIQSDPLIGLKLYMKQQTFSVMYRYSLLKKQEINHLLFALIAIV